MCKQRGRKVSEACQYTDTKRTEQEQRKETERGASVFQADECAAGVRVPRFRQGSIQREDAEGRFPVWKMQKRVSLVTSFAFNTLNARLFLQKHNNLAKMKEKIRKKDDGTSGQRECRRVCI